MRKVGQRLRPYKCRLLVSFSRNPETFTLKLRRRRPWSNIKRPYPTSEDLLSQARVRTSGCGRSKIGFALDTGLDPFLIVMILLTKET